LKKKRLQTNKLPTTTTVVIEEKFTKFYNVEKGIINQQRWDLVRAYVH
jgi:hypothetical protein